MSKGKIARVAAMLGYKSHKLLSVLDRVSWRSNLYRAVVLKSDNYVNTLLKLKNNNIKYECHIDAGLVGVEPGSNCGVVFFYDGSLFDEEKLL